MVKKEFLGIKITLTPEADSMKTLIKRVNLSQKRIKKTGLALILMALSCSTLANTVLDNGTAVSNLRGASGSSKFFSLAVEAGATNLNFTTLGGRGDADLYVKFGSQPTSSSYDCRSNESGNDESCDITNIQEGDYHVMLQANSTYRRLTLSGSYDTDGTPPPGDSVLENGVAVNDIAGAASEEIAFKLDVPSGASDLTFAMSGGTGDADLHVKFGSAATSTSYDCRPYDSGNDEVCSIANVQTGTYHVMIRGYSNFSGVSLIGVFNEDGTPDPDPVPGVQNVAVAGDSITRAFAADCTYNTTFWGLLCPAGGDQPHHSWFDGSSGNVDSVLDRYQALDSSINGNQGAATSGAEMVGLRASGSEPSFAAQAETIAAQSPPPDHVEFILGGNDICSRECLDPANCNDPIYSDEEWRQAVKTGLNTLVSDLPTGSSILVGSVPRVQDILQAGIEKQANDVWVNCESMWSSFGICRIVTQETVLNGESLTDRLAGVAAAQKRYNAILAEESAAYNSNSNGLNSRGIEVVAEYVDENTPSGGTFAFGAEHINGGDCFHPNVQTQNEIAELMWNANTDKP
jgi:hypothetical protein